MNQLLGQHEEEGMVAQQVVHWSLMRLSVPNHRPVSDIHSSFSTEIDSIRPALPSGLNTLPTSSSHNAVGGLGIQKICGHIGRNASSQWLVQRLGVEMGPFLSPFLGSRQPRGSKDSLWTSFLLKASLALIC